MMKIAVLYLLFLLCTLIDLGCEALQFFCKYLNAYATDCSELMNKTKCRLSDCYTGISKSNKVTATKEEKPNQKPSEKPDNQVIVGSSKTIFMTELPVLKIAGQQTVEAYKTEQLETITGGSDSDGDTEPDDFSVDNGVSESDVDNFDLQEQDDDFSDNSSGVSFEELSESVEVLSKNDPTEQEKEKTAEVLDAIEGTELFKFITINNTVYQNAKTLMNSFRNGNLPEQESFDINKFLN